VHSCNNDTPKRQVISSPAARPKRPHCLLWLLCLLHRINTPVEVRISAHVRLIRNSLEMCKFHQAVFEGFETSLSLGLLLLQTADSFVFLSIIRFESLEFDFEIVGSTAHARVKTPAFGEIWVGGWRSAEVVHFSCI